MAFSLSTADSALFKALQEAAILPEAAKPGDGELVQLFKQKKREEQKKDMEPYADILEEQLKVNLWDRKNAILKQLKQSKSSTFTAELFSWKTVSYYETIWEQNKRVAAMTREERREHGFKKMGLKERIERNGWESTFGVKARSTLDWGDDVDRIYWSLYPVKVDRIFRHSDLARRLSLALGPTFYPYITWDPVEGATEVDGDGERGFQVYKKTLCVRYYPFGVPKQSLELLLQTAKEQAQRRTEGKVRCLDTNEMLEGIQQLILNDEDVAMMSLYSSRYLMHGPADNSCHYRGCSCGCEEDDD